jgi:light-independent protochlorophyllide reductase subunit B
VQDFPAKFSPQMGFAGADTIFDTWVHPLMMGLEEHLLGMFRHDSEFDERPSHLGRAGAPVETREQPAQAAVAEAVSAAVQQAPYVVGGVIRWLPDAEKELKKIPFFVRGKARRNTEAYASERGIADISVETLYEAKAHFSR